MIECGGRLFVLVVFVLFLYSLCCVMLLIFVIVLFIVLNGVRDGKVMFCDCWICNLVFVLVVMFIVVVCGLVIDI